MPKQMLQEGAAIIRLAALLPLLLLRFRSLLLLVIRLVKPTALSPGLRFSCPLAMYIVLLFVLPLRLSLAVLALVDTVLCSPSEAEDR